jgi:mannose/fructose/N-acetylgalactosamine-specific phosphotransferase system component IIC
LGYAVGVVLVVALIDAIGDQGAGGLLVVLLVGSLGGWISAFGGAWKDAPVEGFQPFKFVRSPLVALGYALLLAALTTDPVYAAFGALGYTVATLETYKTFFKPNTPRGKFAGKDVRYPEWLERRYRFVPLYVAIWIGIVVVFVAALVQPHHGLI